ncbi:MAG TPA: GDP-mannose 4,6-dehydratase [Gemmatimonadales bacterium]|nr:GDP-mannose 4,6-dehydratase [Gemmatimonadales bacterium]
MRQLLVTGADGFVGRWLVQEARDQGWAVTAAVGPGGAAPETWLRAGRGAAVPWFEADITSDTGRARLAEVEADAVVHLAAVSSGAAARQDPEGAMQVNAMATVGLLEALWGAGRRPKFLFVSTGEVYGAGHDGPIPEDAPLQPVSPYAASKFAAEPAVLDMAEAGGMEAVIARAFPHTGPGQSTAFVLPAFAARLWEAKRLGEREIAVGNLNVIRDFLDVRDVVRAYLLLLERGQAGKCYNVASGVGQQLRDCFVRLAGMVGVNAVPREDASLVRPVDIPVLIGDATKLKAATGWQPTIDFEQTLQDLLDAQAH